MERGLPLLCATLALALALAGAFRSDKCGGTIKIENPGYLTSPGYPHSYHPSEKCEWLIQAPEPYQRIMINFNPHFDLEDRDCKGQENWLQLDHRVLEHDLPKKPGPAILHFAVRFYIESISFLKDKNTVELFFLNAKACVHKGQIEVDSETIFKLAALVLQESKGDYTSDENARKDLKTLPVFPTKTLQEHPSLAYCEDRVIEHYLKIKGLTRGHTGRFLCS